MIELTSIRVKKTVITLFILLLPVCLGLSQTKAQLSGIYTIGGASPDYANFSSAATDLNTFGVSGPVTFNVRDGVYNEQFWLFQIPGTSSSNTVTFQSESGINTAVELMYTAQGISSNYTLYLIDLQFVSFKQMKISGPDANPYGVVLAMIDVDDVVIEDCIIDGHANASSIDQNTINIETSSNVSISNCTILEGWYGIHGIGNGAELLNGLNLSNNLLRHSGTAIRTEFSGTMTIAENLVDSTAFTPVTIYDASDVFNVSRNQITAGSQCLFVQDASVPGATRSHIKNNFFMSPNATNTNGVTIKDCFDLDVVFNSIYVNEAPGASISYGLKIENGDDMDYLNNNIVCLNCEDPVLLASAGSNITLDYGNFYTQQPFTSFTLPVNSVSLDPQYVSSNDLHLQSSVLDNLGIPFPLITTDIDGDIRNAVPTIGADKRNAVNNDGHIYFDSIVACGNPAQVVVQLRNDGSNTINNAVINWEANTVAQAPANWSGTLLPAQEVQIILGNYPVPYYGQGPGIELKSWITTINGGSDGNMSNDTTTVDSAFLALSGTYTIGGTAPDFLSFNETVSAMQNGGVCGPVIFEVRDGSYQEEVYIHSINGISELNPVWYRSESGNSASVSLTTPNAVNWVLLLERMHDFRFSNISFSVPNPPFGNGSVIQLIDPYNMTFDGNVCFGGAGGTGTEYGLLISDPDSNIVVQNNHFYMTRNGVVSLGSVGDRGEDLHIENNLFQNWDDGVELQQTNNCEVLRNDFECGLRVTNCDYIISGYNRISTAGTTALIYQSSSGDVYNNSIKLDASATANASALDVLGSTARIQHNTVYFTGAFTGSNTHNAMQLNGAGHQVTNNILYVNGPGSCIQSWATGFVSFDHNIYYSDSSNLTYTSSTLGQLQVELGMNVNSLHADPQFQYLMVDSLFPTNPLVLGTGSPVGWFNDDLYGNTRDPLFPDPGAFESLNPPFADLGPDTVVCDSLVLNAGNTGSTYLWSTSETTQTITVSSSGTYWVTITNALGSDQDTINVTVGNAPTISLPSTSELCPGDSVLLDAGNPGSTYSWNTGPSTQSIYAGTTGVYIVQVTTPEGCNGFDTTLVSIYTIPQIFLGNDTAICIGDSLLLDAGNAGSSFLWSTTDTTQTIYASSAGNYYVDIVHSCGVATDSVIISTTSLPTASITGVDTICEGTSTTLTASGGGSYLWSTSETSAGIVVSPISSSWYAVLVSNASNCTDSAAHFVFVEPAVTGLITGDTLICEGDSTTLTASGGLNYSWDTGAQTAVIEVSPISTTLYQVNIDNGGICSASVQVTVTVNPLPPIPVITQNGSDLTTTATGSLQWFVNDTLIVGANSQTYTPTHNGVYHVTVTNTNGCTSTSADFDFLYFGIAESENFFSINIYPNPIENGSFTIECSCDIQSIELYDIQGAKILSVEGEMNRHISLNNNDLTGVSPGIYVLRVESGQLETYKKVVIKPQ